ncbi:MAG: UbiA family prenyltransferase [Candidatus Thermoplasmatota archaeon]|nr:UbiA family prenyltransferase [Candidatus Thermoplasmatota archaeon]
MKVLKAIWELMRLEHGVMIAIAILIGSIIALEGEGFPALDKFILTFFTALFLEASTFALNDYFDIDIDKKNNRTDRPLVRGDLQPNTALYLFAIFFPLGILCSYFVNLTCFFIALVTAFLAVLYDAKLKKIKLLGNFYIAYVMAIPFIFGGAAVLGTSGINFSLHPAILIVALIAFLAGSGREIMKDVMDFTGDREQGVKSFPKYIGIRASNVLAAFFYLIAIALSFVPFFIENYNIYYLNYYYLVPILLTDTMLLSTSLQLIFKKDVHMKLYRKFTLLALFIGLIGFLLGAFMQ